MWCNLNQKCISTFATSSICLWLLIWKQRPLVACHYNNKQTTKTATETEETLASPGSQRWSSCSSWRPWMKWWTDCCDQLFPGFKTPWLWVAQHCKSSTPPSISRNCRHIEASYWRTKTDPQYTTFCLNLQKGQPNWWLAAQYKNSLWHNAGTRHRVTAGAFTIVLPQFLSLSLFAFAFSFFYFAVLSFHSYSSITWE